MSSILPPKAPKKEKIIKQLGFTRTDPYAWLKDDNWQEVLSNPSKLKKEIKQYLEQENNYANKIMQQTKPLQNKLFLSLKSKLADKESSPELPDGSWIYYSRFEEGKEHKCFYRKSIHDFEEQLLIDPNIQASTIDYYKIGSVSHSPNHKYFAYIEDTQGSEIWHLKIKNLETGDILPQSISPCSGSYCFSPCSQYIFWVYRDDQGRPTAIYRHHIATSQDTLVYKEKNSGFFINIERSLSNQWIYITANNHDISEVWIISGQHPTHAAICFKKRRTGVFYKITDWNNHFIIYTNEDNAYNFKLMRLPIPNNFIQDKIERKNWQNWINHNPDIYLMEFKAFKNYFIRLERHEVNAKIIITNTNDENEIISGDEDAYLLSLDETLEYDTEWLRYSYQSPTTPRCWNRFHIPTGKKEIIKQQKIPCGYNSSLYESKRIWAIANDGEKIPMTLTYRKDIELNGKNPTLLYGYGSYGYAIDPVFSITALNYIEQGWIYAIAHIRGGSEKGWNWFMEGRRFNKINTFTDFICCADYLVEQNYTQPKKIVADGRSAGGMVMGYIANERPDLFAAIIAVVPFVDILNTMSDITLPLTPPEWPEWGNPLKDSKAYQYIASYSPYDNIKEQDYPAILAMGGLTDPRVTYWEPSKWIAKLRDHNISSNPLLLKINMDSGHGGAAGRYTALKEAAFIQAFAISIIKKEL